MSIQLYVLTWVVNKILNWFTSWGSLTFHVSWRWLVNSLSFKEESMIPTLLIRCPALKHLETSFYLGSPWHGLLALIHHFGFSSPHNNLCGSASCVVTFSRKFSLINLASLPNNFFGQVSSVLKVSGLVNFGRCFPIGSVKQLKGTEGQHKFQNSVHTVRTQSSIFSIPLYIQWGHDPASIP